MEKNIKMIAEEKTQTIFCKMIKISGCFVIQSLVFYNQQLCVAFFCVIIQKRF
mgnify:CR=1 FL=1